MTSHRDCLHPPTKAARVRCRKGKAEIAKVISECEAEEKAYYKTYIRPFEEQDAARKAWEAECDKFCDSHIDSAHQNADDTSVEEGFPPHSRRWYEVALSTLHHARDNADRNIDQNDPEKGQALRVKDRDDWYWVSGIRYENGWAAEIEIIDRKGNREKLALDQIDS